MKVLRDIERQMWLMYVPVQGGTQVYISYFGGITLRFLNIFNAIKNEKVDELGTNQEDKEAVAYLSEHKEEWEEYFEILDHCIRDKEEYDNYQKFQIWEFFSKYTADVFRRAYGEEPLEEVTITFQGYEMIEDLVLERFELLDSTTVFYMDLKECLFGSMKDRIQKCGYCGDYFIAESGKYKYCDDCQKILDKIKYEKRSSDPIQSRIKKIQDTLGKRSAKEWNDKLQEFNFIAPYYRDKVKGKNPEPIPEIDEKKVKMRTERDLIRWLDAYLDSIRIYKKK